MTGWFDCSTAKSKLNVIRYLTLAGGNIRCVVRPVTSVEGDDVVKGLSSNSREVNPDLGLVGACDRVRKVDLVATLVDTVWLGRNLDGDARSDCSATAPGFFVVATRLYRKADDLRRAGLGYRPDVDIVRAAVRDDGLGLRKGHERTQGENAARHDWDGIVRLA